MLGATSAAHFFPNTRLFQSFSIKDAGGVALSPDGKAFLITTGAGEFLTLSIDSIKYPKALARNVYSDVH